MDWLTIADRFGIPGAILIALLIGIVKASKFFGMKILIPITERHIQFLDRTATCMETQSNTVQAIQKQLANVEERQRDHMDICSLGKIKPDKA